MKSNACGTIPFIGMGRAHRKPYIPVLHIYRYKIHRKENVCKAVPQSDDRC